MHGHCDARPMVNFPVAGYCCPTTGRKLYYLARVWTSCPRSLPLTAKLLGVELNLYQLTGNFCLTYKHYFLGKNLWHYFYSDINCMERNATVTTEFPKSFILKYLPKSWWPQNISWWNSNGNCYCYCWKWSRELAYRIFVACLQLGISWWIKKDDIQWMIFTRLSRMLWSTTL